MNRNALRLAFWIAVLAICSGSQKARSHPTEELVEAHSSIQIIGQSKEDQTVQAEGGRAGTKLEVRALSLKLVFPSGSTGYGQLISLFEPRGGHFWWTYRARDSTTSSSELSAFLRDHYIYLEADKVVVFSLLSPPPSIWVRESHARHKSVERAHGSALALLDASLSKIERGSAEWFRQINLAGSLGSDFFLQPGSVIPLLDARILEVAREDSYWVIRLQGSKAQTAIVTLRSDYELQETRGPVPSQQNEN
jgi:hypothetical protein